MLALAAVLMFMASDASALRFGVGGFAGLNIPVAQDDATMGTAFGAKARVMLIPFVGIEPNFTYMQNGDAEVEIPAPYNETMTREAGTFTSFGADLVFGSIQGYTGLSAYGIGGISFTDYSRDTDAIPSISNPSYWLGLGLEYGVNDQISIDVRAKVMIFPYDEGEDTGSRKNGLVSAGVTFFFGEGGVQ
jgi:opacity protein-like surface antigen